MSKHEMISITATQEEMAALLAHVCMAFTEDPMTNTEWMLLKLAERHALPSKQMSMYQRDVLALEVIKRFDSVMRCRDGR